MTREEWESECAAIFQHQTDMAPEMSKQTAEVCADAQADEYGDDVAKWDSPKEAYDNEISHWVIEQ